MNTQQTHSPRPYWRTPAPQALPLYLDEDSTDLILDIEALIARYAGQPQESYFEALEGQILFGMVS